MYQKFNKHDVMASHSAAAGDGQGVRKSIQLLSSLLASCGIPKVPSEAFRQAKFNKPQAVEEFWSLLALLLRLFSFLDTPTSAGDLRSHILNFKFSKASRHNLRQIASVIRKHLLELQYFRADFYAVDIHSIGSRELLFAVGWLIQRGCLFRRLTDYHLKEAARVAIPVRPTQKFLLRRVEEDIECLSSELKQVGEDLRCCSPNNPQALKHGLQRLTWLKGKVLLTFRAVMSAQSAYLKAASHLQSSTLSSISLSPQPLTVHELFLLRYPDQLSSYINKLEWHVYSLQCLVEWKSHENRFWQWMESVLDLEEREVAERKETEEEEDHDKDEVLMEDEQLSLRVKKLQHEVSSLFEKNKPHIDCIYRVWRAKEKTLLSGASTDLREQLAKPVDLHHLSLLSKPESPSATELTVESLDKLDTALCLPKPTTKPMRGQALSSSYDRQQELSSLLRASEEKSLEAHRSVVQMEETVRRLKTDVEEELNRLKRKLPPAICEIKSS